MGPTSPMHLLEILQASPGPQLEIDHLYTPTVNATLTAAASNDWHTLALRSHGVFGPYGTCLFGTTTLVKDAQGNTALLLACQHGHSEATQVLLHDPRVNPKRSLTARNHLGDTPLLAVTQTGNDRLVSLLMHTAGIGTWGLVRVIRLDGHTLFTLVIQSQNEYLLHMALEQDPFKLLCPTPFLTARTFVHSSAPSQRPPDLLTKSNTGSAAQTN